eukprot:TRINITY_DN26281_c0_g1_i1.p1 TRINITY_DN26281_c0_g1~~TRINITY_DN26281_c0_g1_i1.p1  ORF type:complete len:177 (+),score=26.17 TRINITY_DN26281_c0_g1_i1:98-628(+)
MELSPLLYDIQTRLHNTMKRQSLELTDGLQSTCCSTDYLHKRAFGSSARTEQVSDLTLFGEMNLRRHPGIAGHEKHRILCTEKDVQIILSRWLLDVLYPKGNIHHKTISAMTSSILLPDGEYEHCSNELPKRAIYLIQKDNKNIISNIWSSWIKHNQAVLAEERLTNLLKEGNTAA